MKKNKRLQLFLLKFFVSYLVMVGIYSFYLSKTQKSTPFFTCAPITNTVAKQTKKAINLFGYKAKVNQHQNELSLKILVENKYVARVIEGCNSISIIILFLAFIIAFSGTFKHTIIFGVIGSLLIYLINIFRIAILSIGILEYPQYQEILHSLVFPAIIYGSVFLLWIIWVNKFSHFNKNLDV